MRFPGRLHEVDYDLKGQRHAGASDEAGAKYFVAIHDAPHGPLERLELSGALDEYGTLSQVRVVALPAPRVRLLGREAKSLEAMFHHGVAPRRRHLASAEPTSPRAGR